MPFGPIRKDISNVKRVFLTEDGLEHAIDDFLEEYQDLVEKYNLLLLATAVPFQIVVKTMDSVIASHKNGNDWHNYHEPIAPETKQGVLDEILDIPFKME